MNTSRHNDLYDSKIYIWFLSENNEIFHKKLKLPKKYFNKRKTYGTIFFKQ